MKHLLKCIDAKLTSTTTRSLVARAPSSLCLVARAVHYRCMNRRPARADEEAPDAALSDDEEEDSLRAAEQGYQLFRGLVLCCCGASFAAIAWCAWHVST